MIGKYYQPYRFGGEQSRLDASSFKMRKEIQRQQIQFRKQLFGQHYNHSFVSLNKEKKFLKEEERNTQIERANRILLEKITKMSSRPKDIYRRKNITEVSEKRQSKEFDWDTTLSPE